MLRHTLAALVLVLAPLTAGAAVLGEDGLHKTDWMRTTFKDMAEDLEAANEEGKRLAIIFEQRGCIYCTKMHEEVFPDPDIDAFIKENYFIVQMNLFGDEEVTDFDGAALPEKEMARRWGIIFTPTILFLDDVAPESGIASAAAVSTMPGAFGKWTTLNMFRWVQQKGYETDEHFQKFHAREFEKQRTQ